MAQPSSREHRIQTQFDAGKCDRDNPKGENCPPVKSWRAKRVILCIYELWSLLRRLIKAQKKSDRITLSLQLWRKGRDSNPRYSCPYTAFRVRPDRPLRHLSFEKRCKDMYFFVKLYHLDAKKYKKECILQYVR